MEVFEEVLFAFLSILPFAAGLAMAADSLPMAVPIPTKSTNVDPASLYSLMLLLSAIAALESEYKTSGATAPS